ncbi:unnamed protein product [Boreogadus saida]
MVRPDDAGVAQVLTAPAGDSTRNPAASRRTPAQPKSRQLPGPSAARKRPPKGAVRKNVVTRSATDAEVTKHAIRWFNLAADRAARRRVPPPSTPPPE